MLILKLRITLIHQIGDKKEWSMRELEKLLNNGTLKTPIQKNSLQTSMMRTRSSKLLITMKVQRYLILWDLSEEDSIIIVVEAEDFEASGEAIVDFKEVRVLISKKVLTVHVWEASLVIDAEAWDIWFATAEPHLTFRTRLHNDPTSPE